MPELNIHTKKLINSYQLWYKSLQPPETAKTLHVDEVAAKVAAFYEKFRGILEWQEEHLLKRRAIERALKRRLFTGVDFSEFGRQNFQISEDLVLELIRGGHFPNDQIETSKVQEVQRAIDKHIFILKNSSAHPKKSKFQLLNWLLPLVACEIEEILSPSLKERALINYMFSLMAERIKISEGVFVIGPIGEKEKHIQIYIAVQRALFKLDPAIISYHLLKYHKGAWTNLSQENLKDISKNIFDIWESLEKDLNHSLAHKFYNICENYDATYLILGDIISADPMKIQEEITKPEQLEGLLKNAYQKRLKTIKSRLARAAFYATLSIFLGKIVIALAAEIPVDKYITGQLNTNALLVNILVPPLLMFLLIITIRPPQKGNLEKLIMEAMKIVYENDTKDHYELRISRRKNMFLQSIVILIYLLSFAVSFGIIITVLWKLNFPIFSDIIFIIFLSLIAFAGTKIRQRAKELQIGQGKEPLLHLLVDPFSLPFVQLGKWLTARWQKYNVIASFFNILIDVPFFLFVEFLEQWRYFLKEKKEEIH